MDILSLVLSFKWLFSSAACVLLTTIILFIEKKTYKYLLNKAETTTVFWDDCLIKALYSPLKMLIIVFGFIYAIHFIIQEFIILEAYSALFDVIKILTVNVFLLWFLIRFIDEIESTLFKLPKKKRRFDKTTIRAISQISSILITILIVLNVIKPVFGVPISALLAFGGIGGIAVALACQDLLSNIFGGFFIYLDRPFDIGDWISSPERDIEGVVEQIGMRLTKIRTFDKTLRYIPNSVFSKIIVDNPSRMSHRRIKMSIGVRYDDAAKIEKIIRDVDAMLHKNDFLDSTMLTYARFLQFSASSIDFEVYAFTKETKRADYLSAKQNVSIKIIAIVEKHGAEMAFPTRTLHVVSDDAEVAAS